MRLAELASLIIPSRIEGDKHTEITGLSSDSRKVRPGDLFFCIPGLRVDGHQFADQAVQQGAVALVVSKPVKAGIPQIVVNDTRHAMAVFAAHYHGYPSSRMKLIGVTGTNGKTTTTHLIEKILRDAGHSTGLMGTIRVRIGERSVPAEGTTQDVLELQENLRKMADANTEYCVMEVSSHALEQGRVKGCAFRTAIFTNLTQDHLDYHGTMDRYKSAKGLFFSRLGNTYSAEPNHRQFAILNADDPASEEFARLTAAHVITYGVEKPADISADQIRVDTKGTSFCIHTFEGSETLRLRLIGKFNVYNALAATAAALVEGIPLSAIKRSLEQVAGVDGRFENVDEGQPYSVIVDYAHTPDSLENVLKTIREFARKKVISVFGCGGDRDRTKRPLMGAIACRYSDFVIVTSDNPRSEDPLAILKDVEKGMVDAGFPKNRYTLLPDRKEAIYQAIAMARPEDVVLIAGKGHETYQIVNGKVYDFDDRLVAREAIRGRIP